MLGKRSPQRGFFEADHLYAEWVGRKTFYGFLAEHRGQLFEDKAFAKLYCLNNGRPSVPPSLLATALLLQWYDDVPDEEARDRAKYDLRWKVALGVEVDEQPYAKVTLQVFRAQLIVKQMADTIFKNVLKLATKQGVLKQGQSLKVAQDTTPILGRGAVKDTYNLLGDGIVLILRELAKQAAETPQMVAAREGLERYVTGSSLKGEADIDWTDAGQRAAFLRQVVVDADRLLEVVRVRRGELRTDSLEDRALAEAAGLLSQVLAQDIERKEDGPAIRRGVSKDRMPSVHDPEMRHGRKSKAKRFDGHKAQVVADTDSQLILAADVLPGNAADQEGALALVEQAEANTECVVEETIGDCAYGAGPTRQEFADAGRTLVASVPASTNRGRYPKAAFQIDPQAGTCVCPANQISTTVHHFKRGGGQFVFAASVCAVCPLRSQCVRGKGGRTVQLHPQEALLQQARALQHSPPFRDYRRRRQAVEHAFARLVQRGLRQARYMGRPKTRFQLLMAAAVVNLTLLAGLHGGLWSLLLGIEARLLAPIALMPAMAALFATYHLNDDRPSPLSQPFLDRFWVPGSRPHPLASPGIGATSKI
jgi:transposase